MPTEIRPGTIVLAATPIGDPDDASVRLRGLLASADLIAAEDTRRLRALAARLEVTIGGRVVSYHEHNEAGRGEELVQAAQDGQIVLVVTDAGMPAVSDPGYRVVRAAAEAGVPVTAAPGPSAVLTAIALSGLPSDRFCFEGFLPRKAGDRERVLTALATEQRTMVFFESPHRIEATLTAMAGVFGGARQAAACRELTKTYEEVRRGPLAELVEWAGGEMRGELTVVVTGAAPEVSRPEDYVDAVLERVATGERLKEAVAAVAHSVGVSKRELYEAALRAR
ncbi:16S rRNA (cytidine(1402)-2'-O)-methyltransferase [Ruania alkalisoli]|uniref:Ribosomal RNA small subunit methyltransferase I n=1 Tax=Ruania alkalisoli TaxID=2779775 RepID=A0A7M1SVK5_9MICO|nr:16S rRNA (cytidine(1402)-2'-O)-methyltransferase [Ruania alkalisoli]QOR71599.1 16S rRNA (cytidine(1402)-2'-O)-methyltransferase [Ruania alkalisoli]